MINNSNLDRLVVDQRRRSQTPETDRAVRSTRRKLVAAAIQDDDATDALLARSAERMPSYAYAMIILVLAVGLVGSSIVNGPAMIAWTGLTASLYLILAAMMRAPNGAASRTASQVRTRLLIVNTLQVLIGTCWLWLAVMPCASCASDAHLVFRANALLAAMATAALLQADVRMAVPLAFGPATVALLLHVRGADDGMGIAMVGVAAAGLAFFSALSARTRAANIVALRLEREKDALIGELETAKAISDSARHKAEEANLAKSRFLASMSHELRTPLNAILGFSEVMVEEILGPIENPIYADYLKDIQSSGKHLLGLINEILDLSRIEANRYPLDLQPHALADLARSASSTLRVNAGRKGITIRERFADELSTLQLDERAIIQTILNLLSNAIKFTPQGGEVTIAVGRTAGGGQYLSVIDNGPGIPKDELPLVLSAFGQGSIALKHAEQGTGLGLAIVQALMTRHGGRFALKSQLRRGTQATLVFPAVTPVVDEVQADEPTLEDRMIAA